MKATFFAVLAAACVAIPSYGAGHGGWGGSGGGSHWGGTGPSSWNDHGWSSGGHATGHGMSGHGAGIPASHSMSFAHNSGFTHGIVSHQGFEHVPNHYYYHNEGGFRYWHFYDHAGLHWYGFYFGPRFCWFPYWGGYWWWWDVAAAHWVWWYNGYWWWYAPGGVIYIDVNDQYIPYDQYAAQVQAQAPTQAEGQTSDEKDLPKPPSAPPSAPPSVAATNTPASHGGTWKSPDGRRMVQVADGGAFLYDESSSPPALMKTLAAKDVEDVRFSGGKNGQPTQILLNYKDGTFALLDADGNPAKSGK